MIILASETATQELFAFVGVFFVGVVLAGDVLPFFFAGVNKSPRMNVDSVGASARSQSGGVNLSLTNTSTLAARSD